MQLSAKFRFDPSKNVGKQFKDLKLHYMVTILQNGVECFATEYSMGMAHAPSYKFGRMSVDERDRLVKELMNGVTWSKTGRPVAILPDPVDVFYCLISDSDVLDYRNFEDWASSIGYEVDSREAERVYNACMKIALELRHIIGEDGLHKLREVYLDY